MQLPTPYGSAPEQELSLLDVLLILRQSWKLITACTLALGLAMLVFAYTATPIYRAEALLAQSSSGADRGQSSLVSQFGGLAAIAGVQLPGSGNIELVLALLQSRALAARFIEEQDLLPWLFPEQWDASARAWRLEPGQQPPTIGRAYRAWSGMLSVSRERNSSLVRVALQHPDRHQAADWLAKYITLANTAMRERDIAEAENQLRFLRAELEKTAVVEIQQSLFRLIESQIKTIMLAKTSTEYALQTIDPPTVPEPDAAVSPKKKILFLAGLVGGLFLGCLITFVRHALRTARPAEA